MDNCPFSKGRVSSQGEYYSTGRETSFRCETIMCALYDSEAQACSIRVMSKALCGLVSLIDEYIERTSNKQQREDRYVDGKRDWGFPTNVPKKVQTTKERVF